MEIDGLEGGCPKFPDNHIFAQLTFIEDVEDMLGNGLSALAEELVHVLLGQPDRFLLQVDINFVLPAES